MMKLLIIFALLQNISLLNSELITMSIVNSVQETAGNNIEDEWDYKEKGPETGAWCKVSSICCNGTRQSPKELDGRNSETLKLGNIKFKDYDKKIKLNALNNGKTAIFTLNPSSGVTPSIREDGLDAEYFFHEIHTHWGSIEANGSEHNWHNTKAALEVQLVHISSTYNNDYQKALNSGDKNALLIFSILYSYDMTIPDYPLLGHPTEGIQNLGGTAYDMETPGKRSAISISLNSLMPPYQNSQEELFRYDGSLTTPPCSEIVIWNILKTQATIDQVSLSEFRRMRGYGNTKLSDNFRPLQEKLEKKQWQRKKNNGK